MNKRIARIFSVIMIITVIMLTFASCKDKDGYEKVSTTDEPTTQEKTTEAPVETNVNPLTGLADLSESAIGARPVAIMVENSPAARPQWGLSSPDIVLEGCVEGGITRMMWIYADVSKVPKIGPVRSARHDYVEIAQGMNAIYGHWGGSNQAYDLIKKLGMKDIDGMKYGNKYFFKDSSRTGRGTEHAGYTNGEYLASAIKTAGIETKAKDTNWTMFKVVANGERVSFGDSTGTCNAVTVEFSSSYKHTFKYNAEEKLYYNYMNDSQMKDGNNNETMKVANVIVMYANVDGYATSNESDKKLREWDLSSGTGLYISNGAGEKITWKKGDVNSPLKFYGSDGNELVVNKGQTWIGVVPKANNDKTNIVE